MTNNSSQTKTRLHVFFSGIVQGVGLRFLVQKIVSFYTVSGFVKNLYDGRVELVLEGDKNILEEIIKQITSSHLQDYIHEVNQTWDESTGEYAGFKIEF
ncbi:acylphosphatase [Chlamydiota bacterium]